jgi:branched-chain amino acid aminotransferase
MKYVSINGGLAPASEAAVSLFDRGFLYADGLFETMAVKAGRPIRWAEHMARLRHGVGELRIPMPFDAAGLERAARELIDANEAADAVLRVNLTRGVGARGYLPQGAATPFLAMTLHPPAGVETRAAKRLVLSRQRVYSGDPLNRLKTTGKLRQVLARGEAAERGADEALLLNERGELAEASGANVFWVRGGVLFTPPVEAGILPGITRSAACALAVRLGLAVRERLASAAVLSEAEGVFLTSSVQGIVEAGWWEGQPLGRSDWTSRLGEALRAEEAADPGFGR